MDAPLTPEQRVFVHVGAPKTGTTFLQSTLFHYRHRLEELGILYPAVHYDDHFFAAVDLQDLDFSGERRPEAAGRWEQVAARVREWPGTSVISHDVLAGATPEQAQQAIESLAPATVHVVCTARNLALQLPSHWQEDVKHGQTADFDEWYERIARRDDSEWQLRWFWRVEDIPDILRRWGATLPPERVHVVTVPRPGAPAPLLWERFTSVIGLAPDAVDISVVYHPNSGLGRAEVELLRRVNVAHAYALPPRQYERDVKGLLGHEILAASMRSPRLMLPERLLSDIGTVARRWSRVLEQAGYDIVGDLAELVPRESDVAPFTDPPDVSPDAVADAAVTAVFVLVTRLAECRDQQEAHHRLVAERDRLDHELRTAQEVIREHASLPTWERIKRTVVEIGRTSPTVGRALRVYRRLRRHR
jgi:hypothetical protein